MIRDQIITVLLNVVFIPIWLCWRTLRWFMVSVFKETGTRLVKIIGGLLAISIIGLATQYFIG